MIEHRPVGLELCAIVGQLLRCGSEFAFACLQLGLRRPHRRLGLIEPSPDAVEDAMTGFKGIQMPNLDLLYGAMLAGVDYVVMGAGIPREIPVALDALAKHEPASLKLDLEDANAMIMQARAHWYEDDDDKSAAATAKRE